ncbi:SDR family oxidoreductase [Alicyclobacillus fastidiosus]|uniref:SDR family oxidoreductase n=1 Tax=Alicyclobacillus fastidiosus TaxID=392011 RepID=A0ABY6ZHD8_9BACL|nr:SDR family oxidoreductase [Alicyclobacillus fastidiosus]WAH42018.1 SDR family oxidoreductase [Alicyclobacillus fastidiosus]GMA63762.1 short chain dehydrogenase [Alicyclobacillus fastidiosus]
MYNFTGKRVLVTGASQGIGEHIVYGFAEAGAKVALLSRREEKLLWVKAQHPKLVEAPVYAADVRDEHAIACVFDDIERNFGGIDILINNAGGSFYAKAADLSPNGFASVLNINLLGPYILSKAAFRLMSEQRRGVIVNIGSVAGRDSAPGMVAYGAAKAGLVNMTRTLATEWGPLGIRVNTVAPGPILTDAAKDVLYQNSAKRIERAGKTRSVGRLGVPADVVEAVLYLASPSAAFINGTTLYVDGGPTVAPVVDQEVVE